MTDISIELATPADDPALRRILRDNPMPGTISVSFEREPDYFIGARVEGPFHQTIVARDRDRGEIIGMGTRSIRDLYLNGTPQAVGYLSQFRADPRYRAMRKTLFRAFAFLHQLHRDGRAPFYLASIIEDNLPARRVFTAGLAGLPHCHEYSRLHSLTIYCRRKRPRLPLPAGLRLERGSSARVEGIVACLQRNGRRYQFSPHWTSDTLFDPGCTPDLVPNDFFLALDGDRVVGCLAVWHQGRFKQTVVRGYSGTLARWRHLANAGARFLGGPVLPPPNVPFRYCHASHLAIDDDRLEVMTALVRAVHNHIAGQGYDYYLLGLCENHPFLEAIMATYPHIDYRSHLYLVAWESELEMLAQVDDRLPAVEISVL